MRVIDAHQHVWDPTAAEYSWLTPELSRLDRAYTHAEVEPQQNAVGVDGSILVQAADNIEDTTNMLREADGHPTILGVVAWVPLGRPAETNKLLDSWQALGAPIVGVRHLVHREADPDWVFRRDVLTGLDVLGERGLPFDFCAESLDLLRNVGRLAERRPELTIVLDHLGKPPIRTRGWQPWADLLAEAAARGNVVAKVSGLNTAAAPGRRRTTDFQPYVDHAIEVFGTQRLMYGGDWPFALQAAADYEELWTPLRGCLDELSESETADVLGATAERVYRLEPAQRPDTRERRPPNWGAASRGAG